ncbi:hypothetical protein RUM43_000378 [Polyplax serrata]|uniref:Nuclear receptor domain-containing protein n=1 Tax=Polyplax serrata TaxID=468196 RepID=A0AAN8XQB0_POLSC
MALVAPPPTAWREPGAMLGPSLGPLGPGPGPGPVTPTQAEDITALVPVGRELQQSTTPGSQANSTQSGGSNNGVDKNQNIECVVCGDKSSGKHYGQFTCEGFRIFLGGASYLKIQKKKESAEARGDEDGGWGRAGEKNSSPSDLTDLLPQVGYPKKKNKKKWKNRIKEFFWWLKTIRGEQRALEPAKIGRPSRTGSSRYARQKSVSSDSCLRPRDIWE